jgi:hypothetical protein
MPKISVYMLHIKEGRNPYNEASAEKKTVKWYDFGNLPVIRIMCTELLH